jgi:predicted TIM-barrel fold metal-dependent hydrolase
VSRPAVFDAHLHIVDSRFPLVANQGYRPEPFTVEDYRARTAALSVVGGAVVSGSFQGFDQGYLHAALEALGPGFVGVTQVPDTVTREELLALDAAGVRGLRFNLHRGGRHALEGLDRLGRRVAFELGWHSELYVDARDLPEIAPRLDGLPGLVVDHLGLSRDGLPHLLALVEGGLRVKATGFGRGDVDVPLALRAISAVNPGALMFGTDLPSTRAARPFADTDVDVVLDALGDDVGRRVLHDNAAGFYGAGRSGAALRPPD